MKAWFERIRQLCAEINALPGPRLASELGMEAAALTHSIGHVVAVLLRGTTLAFDELREELDEAVGAYAAKLKAARVVKARRRTSADHGGQPVKRVRTIIRSTIQTVAVEAGYMAWSVLLSKFFNDALLQAEVDHVAAERDHARRKWAMARAISRHSNPDISTILDEAWVLFGPAEAARLFPVGAEFPIDDGPNARAEVALRNELREVAAALGMAGQPPHWDTSIEAIVGHVRSLEARAREEERSTLIGDFDALLKLTTARATDAPPDGTRRPVSPCPSCHGDPATCECEGIEFLLRPLALRQEVLSDLKIVSKIRTAFASRSSRWMPQIFLREGWKWFWDGHFWCAKAVGYAHRVLGNGRECISGQSWTPNDVLLAVMVANGYEHELLASGRSEPSASADVPAPEDPPLLENLHAEIGADTVIEWRPFSGIAGAPGKIRDFGDDAAHPLPRAGLEWCRTFDWYVVDTMRQTLPSMWLQGDLAVGSLCDDRDAPAIEAAIRKRNGRPRRP